MARMSYKMSTNSGHTHIAQVNSRGAGRTTANNGHMHVINNWRVLPAGVIKHTHTVVKPAT